MDYSTLCFFVGAMPGVMLWISQGLKVRKLAATVETISRREGKYFSVNYGIRDQIIFLLKPSSLIGTSDSEELINAKKSLIKSRRMLFIMMFVSLFVTAVGAFSAIVLYNLIFR